MHGRVLSYCIVSVFEYYLDTCESVIVHGYHRYIATGFDE